MPRQKFTSQLADVYQLLDVADAIDARNPAVSYFLTRPGSQPFVSGAIVLLCARFEEFLRDVITYALDQHGNAAPPIALSDLPQNLQVHIVQQNMTAALQKYRYGIERPDATRLSESLQMAQHYISDQIWSDYAIDTGGNPGAETVASFLKLVGIEAPWDKISQEFKGSYTRPQIPGASSRTITKPKDHLNVILGSRNSAAHSGSHLTISASDVRFDADFLSQLSGWIYDVLQRHIESVAVGKSRKPATWKPR